MSIQEITQKGKEWLKTALQPDILIILVVILTGAGAFELGRLSVLEGQGSAKVPAATVAATSPAVPNPPVAKAPVPSSGTYLASKSGTKYYLPSCSGASRIKDENKVWFKTQEEAQAAGYSPAANCSF